MTANHVSFDISSQATETEAVAEIRSLTPICFRNLLSDDCDRLAEGSGAENGVGMSIDPLIGSVSRREHADGVQFSMLGRLHAGSHRRFDVRVHGIRSPDGVAFLGIERAYDDAGRASPRFV